MGKRTMKFKRIAMTKGIIEELLLMREGQGIKVVKNPLPADVRVESITWKPNFNEYSVIVSSENFDTVSYGKIIPSTDGPLYEKVRNDG
jgi:hypothetical protein